MRSLTRTVGVRVTNELAELLREVSTARGEDVSSFIRRCVRKELAKMGYYPEDVLKALGMEKVEKEGVED